MTHNEKPTREEIAAAFNHDPARCHVCMDPSRHGEQAPDPLELENDALREQVATLVAERDVLREDLARLQRLPDMPWAEVGASIMQRLAIMARDNQPEAKRLVAVFDKAKTYVNRILAERDAVRARLADFEATSDLAMTHAREEEREACAWLVEHLARTREAQGPLALSEIAATIRARKP